MKTFLRYTASIIMAAIMFTSAALAQTSIGSTLTGIAFETVLPLFGTIITAAIVWITTLAGRYIGQKNAALMRQAVTDAITRGIMADEASNEDKTAATIIQEAVNHAKAALPDTLRRLGAQDGPLWTMASAELSILVERGLTTFLNAKKL